MRGAAQCRAARPLVVVAVAAILMTVALAGADEIGSSPAIGEARFPHDYHADELGFECSDCHHETNATRLQMPHEDYFEDFWIDCRTCHREGGSVAAPQSCGDCHHDGPVSTADETLSAKVVIHRSCWECHASGTGEEASRSCGFCHAGPAPAGEVGP